MTRLAILALVVPVLLGAQGARASITPHVDFVAPGTFYRGPMTTGPSATRYPEGVVKLDAFSGWGARLALRPAGSSWGVELEGTTGTTDASASASGGGVAASFSIAGKPARLSLFSLGVARERSVGGRGALSARVAGTLASVTMQQRIVPPPSPSQGGLGDQFDQFKPWSRRYVSPGAEAGIGASIPLRFGLALVASGTFGMVRNETGDMGSNTTSVLSSGSPRREAYWMSVTRLMLGVGLSR